MDETSFSLSLFYFSVALNKIGKNVSMANLTNSGLDSPSPPAFVEFCRLCAPRILLGKTQSRRSHGQRGQDVSLSDSGASNGASLRSQCGRGRGKVRWACRALPGLRTGTSPSNVLRFSPPGVETLVGRAV